jgi:hypothetical protein
MKKKRPISKIITCITGDRVVVGESELRHAQDHFLLPDDIFLELLERVLKEPTVVFVDDLMAPTIYYLFYRLEGGRYLVAVVKFVGQSVYFSTMYSTGRTIRGKHKNLVRLKL